MSIFTIYAPFLLIFFIISVENINYYTCWQFTPVKLVLKWSRSGFRTSRVMTPQVPVGISLPRQKNFSWKHNCQIRHNKLYCHIILSSQTVLRNLKFYQITKKFPIQKRITAKKVKLKSWSSKCKECHSQPKTNSPSSKKRSDN